MARVDRILADATRRLTEAGSPTARLDAEVLLAHVAGRDRTWLLGHPEASITHVDAYRRLVERRIAGEPVAYLRGFKEWRSLRLRTDARALSPRSETELLVDVARDEIIARLDRGLTVTAWDLGTGSGAIAVALGLELLNELRGGRLRLIASDASQAALELARENLADHGLDRLVELRAGDLLAAGGDDGARPDIVTANLPYVRSADVDAAGSSLAHEPRLALDGGPDGLDSIRRLLDGIHGHVASGATLALEVGIGQAPAVRALAPSGSTATELADLAGIARFVVIRLAD
jgi:release factor glutamine methyltransferase